jgi:hypothetical protein
MPIPQPKQNWSMLPHYFIEEMMPDISKLSEMKVLLYVLRHTWGFQDESKKITLDEFQHGRKNKDGGRLDAGCNMSINAIKSGIKSAIAHGYLQVDTNSSDKARIKKTYSIIYMPVDTSESGVSEVDSLPSEVDSLPSEVDSRSEKETIERNYRKKKPLSPTVDTSKQDSDKETKPDKSASSDTKKEKPLDPIDVWAAKHVFEVDPRKTTKSVKFMIGNWRNGIKEVHKLHDTDASTIYLDMWKEYYLETNDGVPLPRNREKLEAHYSKWYDHMKAQQSKTITPPPATWSQDVDIEFELPPVLKPRRSASNE